MKEMMEKIRALKKRFEDAKRILKLNEKNLRARRLELKTSSPEFWADREKAEEIMKESGSLKKFLEPWNKLDEELNDLEEFLQMTKPGEEKELRELESKLTQLENEFENREFDLLFSGKHDPEDAVLSVYAGAGGTDAQDWAEMVMNMMVKFAELRGCKVTWLAESKGEEAGYKSATIKISGLYAYGTFKSESGVHRLVRLSPFDADHARHTSFMLVDVLPFLAAPPEIEIKPEDLKIDTYRASGAGGQHVNTTDSAVRITHLPTGVVVAVQNERSQLQNREVAMKILKTKLITKLEQEKKKELSEIRGESVANEWGSQIRSYVLHPYNKVKDHRTGAESSDTTGVLNGKIDVFVEAYLRSTAEKK